MMATAVNRLPIGKSDSGRSFYDLLEAYKRCIQTSLKKNGLKDVPVKQKVQLPPILQSFYESDHGSELGAFIDGNIIGKDLKISTPFGNKRQVYCDYTASGKALHCIEDYILHKVLPSYANTHTTTSATSLQTTLFREEAREIIRNSVGASEDDAVIFVGSGCTGAIHKLIHCLNLREPPIVLVGASEHHSNLLPWREIAAQVIRIKQSSDGVLDLTQLEEDLKSVSSKNSCNRQLIGCFSAASNITGTLNPDLAITVLIHRYGGLAFFDYATAAPYVFNLHF
jgi:selenocysteine lyase/cysteine desulfurase